MDGWSLSPCPFHLSESSLSQAESVRQRCRQRITPAHFMDTNNFLTHTLRDPRVTRILSAALDAVEPASIVQAYLKSHPLPGHDRLFLLGIGKAAEPMTRAATNSLPKFNRALIITKHASIKSYGQVMVMEAGHPIPDERSLAAGHAALDFVSGLHENDLLICLISGGGSALVTAPHDGISLEDMQLLTTSLLASGASIDEINVIRRQFDRVKGGGLAGATRARIISLILSDVMGNHLEAIASGPTASNPTNDKDALAILRKYGTAANSSLYSLLSLQLPSQNLAFDHVTNIILGDNRVAAQAAKSQAQIEGFHAEIIDEDLRGEARLVGTALAERLKLASARNIHPFCLIAGGETTVTIRGNGKGGRNQELALATVDALDGAENIMLISLATDGDDGPTDAAGAVVTGETRGQAQKLGIVAADYLSRNDAYHFFEPLGDLLKPGYTGTNVNDLIFLIGL